MSALRTLKFKDFITLQRGFDLPKSKREPGEYPVIGATGIHGSHVEFKVEPPVVTTGRSGSLGHVVLCNERAWPLNTSLWVKDFKGNDPRYVYYFLQTLDLKQFNSGAGVPTLNRNHLDNLEISILDSQGQQNAASVLCAYDDLIENNTRRIEILEEIGRRVYEEWFTNCRATELARSGTASESPSENWPDVILKEIASVNPESVRKNTAPDSIHYIDISSVSPGQINEVTELDFQDAPSRARRRVSNGDILWSCVRPNRRSYALVIDPLTDTIASTGFAVLRATSVPHTFLYYAVTTDAFVNYLVNHATGAAYPAVKQADFEAATIQLPPEDLIDRFESAVEPMCRLQQTLQDQNRCLEMQRDLLIPKLVSGQVDVSDAQSGLEDAVA